MKYSKLFEADDDNLHEMPPEHLHAVTHEHLVKHGYVKHTETSYNFIGENAHHYKHPETHSYDDRDRAAQVPVVGRFTSNEYKMIDGLREHGWTSKHGFHPANLMDVGEAFFEHPNGSKMGVWRDHDEGDWNAPWNSRVDLRIKMRIKGTL